MKNKKSVFNIALALVSLGLIIVTGCATVPQSGGLIGTFEAIDYDLMISFTGNQFVVLTGDGNTYAGSYDLRGDNFTLRGHGQRSNFMTGRWNIVNSNTIRDADGDIWMRVPESFPLSGTYSFGSAYNITFTGSTYVLRAENNTYRGNYLRIGDEIMLLGHGTNIYWIREAWYIVNANTIEDADGDLWVRR